MSSRKRQRRRRSSPDYTTGGDLPRRSSPRPPISELLYHQAHEATIIRNRPDLAKALKAHDGSGGRSALIKWHGETFEKDREVWLDRYVCHSVISWKYIPVIKDLFRVRGVG